MTVAEHTLSGSTFMTVSGPWTESDADDLRRKGIDEIWLNYAHGFQEPDLTLLADLPLSITRVHIVARRITDLEPIYALAGRLQSLSVTTAPTARLDLVRLPLLRSLAADWPQVKDSLQAACQLEQLYLGHFGEPDLTALANLQLLEQLTMKDYPRVRNLNGLSQLAGLRRLTIAGGRSLADIDDLASPVGRQLRELDLDSCRRIESLDSLAHCTSLTHLNLGNIGSIPSADPLGFLGQLTSLYLYESTRFEDGDLRPLLRLTQLTDLRIMNRRSYNPAVDEVRKALELPVS